MYIVSPYLSKGYLDNPKLTSEKFIELKGEFFEGQKAFKTGDKARLMVDGKVDLLGREDRLIKLRGIRIELDEIEGHLAKYAGINRAVVLYNDRLEQISSFIVSKEKGIEPSELIEQIKRYLGGIFTCLYDTG